MLAFEPLLLQFAHHTGNCYFASGKEARALSCAPHKPIGQSCVRAHLRQLGAVAQTIISLPSHPFGFLREQVSEAAISPEAHPDPLGHQNSALRECLVLTAVGQVVAVPASEIPAASEIELSNAAAAIAAIPEGPTMKPASPPAEVAWRRFKTDMLLNVLPIVIPIVLCPVAQGHRIISHTDADIAGRFAIARPLPGERAPWR
jgi:hypothetical protein